MPLASPVAGTLGNGQADGSLDPLSQQLLNTALQHGGAVAQTASEATHPNGSFMTLAYQKLGGSLQGILDTLALPEDAVTALLSQGTGNAMSFDQVRKSRATPSSVLFGDAPKDLTTMQKVGLTSARFVTDVLLDPVTYLTFGEGSGVKSMFGISKLTQIPIKEATAKMLGYSAKDLIQGAKGLETVQYHALSDAGVAAEQSVQKNIENQIKHDTLEQFGYDPKVGITSKNAPGVMSNAPELMGGQKFLQANNIFARIQRRATSLIGATGAEFDNVLKTTVGAENDAAATLKNWATEKGLLGKKDLTPQEADAFRAATQMATKDAMDKQAERLVRHTIGARSSEIESQAKNMMSNIIEQNVRNDGVILDKMGKPLEDQFGNKMVRDLAQEYIDKGGVKFFGQAVVSGAKIRSMLGFLTPSADLIEAKFGAKMGVRASQISHGWNIIRSGFSTNWNEAGRIPDSAKALMDVAKNKASSQASAIVSSLPKLWNKLGVTKDEDKALSWMIAADMPPAAGDKRFETIYNLLHSPNGQATAMDIANGKYGDDASKIWKAAQAIRDTNARSLLAMHESGMAAFPQKNYIANMLNEEKNVVRPFTKFKSSEAVNAQKAEINKWRNVEDPSKVLYGDAGSLQLKRFSKVEERNRIYDQLQKEVLNNKEKRANISKEIEDLWGDINKKMQDSIMGSSKATLKEIAGEDKNNFKALQTAIRDAIPAVDRNKILQTYVDKAYEDGRRIVQKANLDQEGVKTLKENLKSGDEDLDAMVERLFANGHELSVKTAKETGNIVKEDTSGDSARALDQLTKTIKENGLAAKKRYIEEAMSSDKSINDVLGNLSDEWSKNPEGISRTLEGVLGKNFSMNQLMEDFNDTKRGLSMELNTPGLKMVDGRWFYKDKEGAVYERLRASAAAINQNMFDSKEMFTESGLKQTLSEALNVIRTVNTKYLLDDIATKFGVVAKDAPSNYVKVGIKDLSEQAPDLSSMLADHAQTGFAKVNGEELYYHPTVANAINDMMKVMEKDPASNLMLQGYDKVTNFWKASVTSIFPMFHGRNAMSNVFQNMMNIGYEALNPTNHVMAAKLILNNHNMENLAMKVAEGSSPEAFQELMKASNQVILKDKRGYEWTAGEINRVVRDNVIAFNPSILGNMDTQRSSKEMMTQLEDHLFPDTNKFLMPVKKYVSSEYTPFSMGRTVGNTIESQGRMVNFLANLKETGDVEHAAQMTKQALFDYQNLTPFEKNAMRRVIPFYTYTRKNLELMANTLLHRPGRIDSFRNAIQNVGDVFSGGNLSDQEKQMLPAWMQDGLSIVLSRNGDKVNLLTSLQTPIEQPFQALSNLYGSMNPLLKLPIEQTTGYSFFYGKPLSQVTNADAYASPLVPQFLRNYIGFTTFSYTDKQGAVHTRNVALDPQNMNFLMNMPLIPRVLSTLKNMQGVPLASQDAMFTNLLGINPTQIDLQTESAARQKETQAQLEDVLNKAGVGYSFTRFQINKKPTI